MSARVSRWLFVLGLALISAVFGNWIGQRRMESRIAANDNRITALYREVALNAVDHATNGGKPAGTAGHSTSDGIATDSGEHTALVEEIKRQLQSEMGLLPMRRLRELRDSFVELHAYNDAGEMSYGTAGYLGSGYFITVKHVVLPLTVGGKAASRPKRSIKIRYKDKELPARVVDSGDAETEVDPGDWAIIKVSSEINLPPLRIDTDYAFQFAEPIVRMGNDYSKGIILSTGYVGQRMSSGLVTCLTDGHPGVSGGGVVDQEGTLVGIPIGRMEGDYRFSFILPLRGEMFRKVPGVTSTPR
jgi:S1-C subfamily serine protease